MLAIGLFIALPLSLRWFTAWSMRQWRARARRRNQEWSALKREMAQLSKALRLTQERARRFQERRAHLRADIEALEGEVAALRAAAARRAA